MASVAVCGVACGIGYSAMAKNDGNTGTPALATTAGNTQTPDDIYPGRLAPLAVEIYGTVYPITVLAGEGNSLTWQELYYELPEDLLKKDNGSKTPAEFAEQLKQMIQDSIKEYETSLQGLSDEIGKLEPEADAEIRKTYIADYLNVGNTLAIDALYPQLKDKTAGVYTDMKKYLALVMIEDNVKAYISLMDGIEKNKQ